MSLYSELSKFGNTGFFTLGEQLRSSRAGGGIEYEIISCKKPMVVQEVSKDKVYLYSNLKADGVYNNVAVIKNRAIEALPRIICQKISFGTGRMITSASTIYGKFPKDFHNSVVFPRAVLSNRVILSDHNKRQWISSACTSPSSALVFFNLMLTEMADENLMKLSSWECYEEGESKIQAPVEAIEEDWDEEKISDEVNAMSQEVLSSGRFLNPSYIAQGVDYFKPLRGELLNIKTVAVHENNAKIINLVSGVTKASEKRWLRSGQALKDSDTIMFKQENTGQLNITSGVYINSTKASDWKCSEVSIEPSMLKELLSSAGYTLSDSKRGISVDAKTFRSNGGFEDWKESLCSAIKITKSVVNSSNGGLKLNYRKVTYNTKKGDGSCKIVNSAGKSITKPSMDSTIKELGLPKEFSYFDVVKVVTA